jgi:hypothetical protein
VPEAKLGAVVQPGLVTTAVEPESTLNEAVAPAAAPFSSHEVMVVCLAELVAQNATDGFFSTRQPLREFDCPPLMTKP